VTIQIPLERLAEESARISRCVANGESFDLTRDGRVVASVTPKEARDEPERIGETFVDQILRDPEFAGLTREDVIEELLAFGRDVAAFHAELNQVSVREWP
jgi:antitoxin (DNA-binding transcriptional repressor) of toxin-antitoxin stability system